MQESYVAFDHKIHMQQQPDSQTLLKLWNREEIYSLDGFIVKCQAFPDYKCAIRRQYLFGTALIKTLTTQIQYSVVISVFHLH